MTVYLITTIVFVATCLLTWAAFYPLLSQKSILEQRIEKLVPGEKEKASLSDRAQRLVSGLSRLGQSIDLPVKERSKYTKILVASGFRKEAFLPFLGVKLLLSALLPGLFFLSYALPRHMPFNQSVPLGLILGILGYLIPSYWLHARYNDRKQRILHSLPDVLDLMTVCVEAGLSIDAALIKTAENPQFVNDPLAREIRIAMMETRAGKPRIEALKDMAERTTVGEVGSFITMLAQTERFGTSLGQALRVHAESLRTKRKQIAEEAAAKTTIKLIFPLVLFIFPALLVVILGPAAVQVAKLFK